VDALAVGREANGTLQKSDDELVEKFIEADSMDDNNEYVHQSNNDIKEHNEVVVPENAGSRGVSGTLDEVESLTERGLPW